MNRFAALILTTALLGTGCIIDADDDDPIYGDVSDVIVRWEFLRNVRNGLGNVTGTVLYDNADLVHAGSGLCEESFVDTVEISLPGFRRSFPCVYERYQGATVTDVPVGANLVTITGWREDIPVYRGEMVIDVVPGDAYANEFYFSLDALTAPVDLFAAIAAAPGQYYATCAAAGSPDIAFEVFDSFSLAPVLEGVVECSPATAPADGVPVYMGDLDLDNYFIRLAGYTTSLTVPAYESCEQEFDHFETQVGLDGFNFSLAPGVCP